MPYIIKVIQDAAELNPPINAWLVDCDVEAHGGRGSIHTSMRKSDAKRFADYMEVHQYWTRTSKAQPRRDDGKPNRPLTAYHIEVVKVND